MEADHASTDRLNKQLYPFVLRAKQSYVCLTTKLLTRWHEGLALYACENSKAI